jgi:hypothetical protein
VQASFSDLALHLDFHFVHRFIHSRPCDILDNPITCDCQVYAKRLGNSEHQPIANLPVADRFTVFLAACVHV